PRAVEFSSWVSGRRGAGRRKLRSIALHSLSNVHQHEPRTWLDPLAPHLKLPLSGRPPTPENTGLANSELVRPTQRPDLWPHCGMALDSSWAYGSRTRWLGRDTAGLGRLSRLPRRGQRPDQGHLQH